MAKAGIRLVYGGGRIGLMGEVARAVLDAGGKVTGIIPEFLKARELMLPDAQELHVVKDMHARKQLMFDKADAFIALPGGIGTLEELVEQMTWAQLGRHDKPILDRRHQRLLAAAALAPRPYARERLRAARASR